MDVLAKLETIWIIIERFDENEKNGFVLDFDATIFSQVEGILT